jgi:hypothetical protein
VQKSPFGRDIIIDTQLFNLEWDVVLSNFLHVLVAYLSAFGLRARCTTFNGRCGRSTYSAPGETPHLLIPIH